MKFDFSGYATKNDVVCSDGRKVRQNAFMHQDGSMVPLIWQHFHDTPDNVLGHALLENREDGVYAYCRFNDSDAARAAKEAVRHGDVDSLSIYANQLVQQGSDVIHGEIREVSLVLAGANPGAHIDNITIQHSAGFQDLEDEVIIHMGMELDPEEIDVEFEDDDEDDEDDDELEHADKSDENETVADVFNTLSEKQKNVVYYMIGQALGASEEDSDEEAEVEHSDKGGKVMKKNVFDGSAIKKDTPTLTHAQFTAIVEDARKTGSFKQSLIAHAATYGFENVDILFPDAKTSTSTPALLSRQTEWVSGVLQETHHLPFSRVKMIVADITADEARARGYVKGNKKKDEVVKLLKRIVTPTTIYKKQRMDRDDVVDITDLNVIAWLKQEMRIMLNEELARAILVGDGRDAESDDKISETNIIPVAFDDDMYAEHVILPSTMSPSDMVDAIIRARKNYRGSGNPSFYTTTDTLVDMLLIKDTTGRRIYNNEGDLTSALRVSKSVEVPVMEGVTMTIKGTTYDVLGIVVNLRDYGVGADRGGEVNMFDDFDLDYNQLLYLIETRCSGALMQPKSALVFLRPAKTTSEAAG